MLQRQAGYVSTAAYPVAGHRIASETPWCLYEAMRDAGLRAGWESDSVAGVRARPRIPLGFMTGYGPCVTSAIALL